MRLITGKLLLILAFLLVFITACQNETGGKFLATAKSDNTETYKAAVDNLRVRTEPNTNSRIVYQLEEGEEVIFLGEQSDNKEVIKLRGKSIKDNWYKVKIKDDVIGWVFGGALKKDSRISVSAPNENGIKKIKIFSAKQVEALTGLDGIRHENEPYEGRYEYYATKDGKEILDGEFYVKGRTYGEGVGGVYQNSVTYEGTFKNGDKEGDFFEKRFFGEMNQTTHIKFKKNKCTFTKVFGDSEGNPFNDEYLNEECTFDFNKRNDYNAVIPKPVPTTPIPTPVSVPKPHPSPKPAVPKPVPAPVPKRPPSPKLATPKAPASSEFQREVTKIKEEKQLERYLIGKWNVQKININNPREGQYDISGREINKSYIELYENRQFKWVGKSPNKPTHSGRGKWVYNHQEQVLSLDIYNDKRKYEGKVDLRIIENEGGFAKVKVISMNMLRGGEQIKDGAALDIILKKK